MAVKRVFAIEPVLKPFPPPLLFLFPLEIKNIIMMMIKTKTKTPESKPFSFFLRVPLNSPFKVLKIYTAPLSKPL